MSGANEASPIKEEMAAAAAKLEVQNSAANACQKAGTNESGDARLAEGTPLAPNLNAPRQGCEGGTVGLREGFDKRFMIHGKMGALRL